ncbi:MAG: hypothetical protein LC633_10130, partial [Desulfobulbaceae bacterium]|nr:hypothetical protein [Desulfobulbaceae bacterium]
MIGKLFVTLRKDALLLWRDRAGLLLLFVMPAVLVVIITLVQDNVYRLMGETSARVILVDRDRDQLGRLLNERLAGLEMVTVIDGERISRSKAMNLVADGDYQACIIVREGTTARLLRRVQAGTLCWVGVGTTAKPAVEAEAVRTVSSGSLGMSISREGAS